MGFQHSYSTGIEQSATLTLLAHAEDRNTLQAISVSIELQDVHFLITKKIDP